MADRLTKTLIVGEAIYKMLRMKGNLFTSETFDAGSRVTRVGMYGRIPVFLDKEMPPGKLFVTYTSDPGASEQHQCIVRPEENLPGNKWIPLSEQVDRCSETNR